MGIKFISKGLVVLCLCLQLDLFGQDQLKNFNVYLQPSIGWSLLPTHSSLEQPLRPVFTNMSIGIGALGAYTLANTFGIESGYLLTLQHLTEDPADISFFDQDSYEYTLTYNQVPILFFYKISPMQWHYGHLKLRLGTSLDWISWGSGFHMPRYRFLGNVISGISYGVERHTGRVMEFGLSYVRSLKSYEMKSNGLLLKSRMDALSLDFKYYLFKK